jgi:hypothetical protein
MSDPLRGFQIEWKHREWTLWAKGNVHLYEHRDGTWSIAVDDVWVSGVYETASDALFAAGKE